jgi:hypothetical protein
MRTLVCKGLSSRPMARRSLGSILGMLSFPPPILLPIFPSTFPHSSTGKTQRPQVLHRHGNYLYCAEKQSAREWVQRKRECSRTRDWIAAIPAAAGELPRVSSPGDIPDARKRAGCPGVAASSSIVALRSTIGLSGLQALPVRHAAGMTRETGTSRAMRSGGWPGRILFLANRFERRCSTVRSRSRKRTGYFFAAFPSSTVTHFVPSCEIS